jgi:glutamate dehydrogenase/leucine dehydrogenase
VTVSYSGWVQDLPSFFWEESAINAQLARIIEPVHQQADDLGHGHQTPLTMGACYLAVERMVGRRLSARNLPSVAQLSTKEGSPWTA